MLVLRLPGGCAMTWTPASRISSPVMISLASPPPNSVGNSDPKCRFTLSKVSRSSSRVSRSMRRMASSSVRSEEHTSELQSLAYLVCRLLLEKKKTANHACHREHAADGNDNGRQQR